MSSSEKTWIRSEDLKLDSDKVTVGRSSPVDYEVDALNSIETRRKLDELEEDSKLLYQTIKTEYQISNFEQCLENNEIDFHQGYFSSLANISEDETIERVDIIDKADKKRSEWDSQAYRIETDQGKYNIEERDIWNKKQKIQEMLEETKK